MTRGFRTRRRDEGGAIALLVAISMVFLLVIAGMVLDFGLVRVDRQTNKAVADDAVMAGMHAFDQGDAQIYPFRGVCTALSFVQANLPSVSSLSDADCSNATLLNKVCDPADSTTWASFTGTVNNYTVTITSPYNLATSGYPEESLPSLSADQGTDPCGQMAVIITQKRRPGLGSLATSHDLVSSVRSVGRANIGDGDRPPAMLLLERTACSVLTVGSAGSASHIWVYGFGTTPATIHADTNGTGAGCGSGSGQQAIQGKQSNSIVAYGGSDGSTGSVTSVAAANAVASNIVSDGIANVYGTTALNESAVGGVASPVTGRKLVTRRPADRRYRAGVTSAAISAYSQWNLNPLTPTGYTEYSCSPNMATLAALPASAKAYINCNGGAVTLTGSIGAGTIYFHGYFKSGTLTMPNANQVYVDSKSGPGDAIGLSTGDGFCVRATACSTLATGTCLNAATGNPASQAQLIIKDGSVTSAGTGLLRMCNTELILEGGQVGAGTSASPGGCVPLTNGTAPTITPCTGGTTVAGNGSFSLTGVTDWTAPNRYNDMTVAGLTQAQKQVAWNGGEDLALWTESYAGPGAYKMAGGGAMHVGGVFMAPNAAPYTLTGSGAQNLTNAQFIATSFQVNGGATLTMQVDPSNAISLPVFDYTLIR